MTGERRACTLPRAGIPFRLTTAEALAKWQSGKDIRPNITFRIHSAWSFLNISHLTVRLSIAR